MLRVYADPCTVNSRKVLAGLALLGTEYEFEFINYLTGVHKSEKFKKINPNATLPAATDGDLILTESNAILQYAADLGNNFNSAYPKDLKGAPTSTAGCSGRHQSGSKVVMFIL